MSRTCSLYASMSGPMKTFRDSRVYTAVPLQTVEPISTQALVYMFTVHLPLCVDSDECKIWNLHSAGYRGSAPIVAIHKPCRVLPITLCIGYRQFTVGSAYSSEKVSVGTYGPTAPQGLQNNVAENMLHSTSASKINALFASATIPFMPQTSDEVAFPLYLDGQPKPFGFSSILISNTSAAAIDAPLPNHFLDLQKDLKAVEAYFLSANKLRGTVVNNNPTIQDAGYGRRSLPSHKQGYALSKCH
ncbi:hypothetical protein IWW34DRAFT_780996 [Fusarium oxysporum f. sp. albedinis]|nr:hypothetical protein IWW34DRAFT_780996 [Fusarium oxysporum f. sp. albedinis]